MQFTYTPEAGDPDIVRVFGKIFEAGKPVTIDDEKEAKIVAKLAANPTFNRKERLADPAAKAKAKDEEVVRKHIDGRTKEAREARQAAEKSAAEAAAKERALEAAQALAEPDDGA
jgi:hypothetical protein